MPWQHAIAGGQGNLVATSFQSPNFVHDVSGWQVQKNGSAEFNNVTVRNGDIISGTSLYYSGTPAAGNLVASISEAGGTDSFGNVYLAGFVTYLYSGGVPVNAVSVFDNGVTFYVWSGVWDANSSISLVSAFVLGVGSAFQVSGALTATGGTASSPSKIQTDTIQSMAGSYLNSWAAAAAGTDLKWGLTPDALGGSNMVQMSGRLVNTTTITGGPSIIGAVGASYIPVRDEPIYAYAHASGTPFAQVSGYVLVRAGSGDVEYFGSFSSSDTLEIAGRYPLAF